MLPKSSHCGSGRPMQTNLNTDETCEACGRHNQVERIDDDDTGEPYLVCNDCAQRLRLRALRPSEWFNIASKHGWQKYLLHDDFYDQVGTALQPDMDNYSTDGMFAPSLIETSINSDRLLDYCITRWRLDQAEFEALRSLPFEKLFATLKQRVASGNTHLLEVGLSICANVLDTLAATWVADQYERSCEQDALFSWAKAAARCLPQEEGLKMTIDALERYKGQELQDRMGALLWFRSPLVLDWIERNAPDVNIADNWGQLAALSNLTWTKADTWLTLGRPFSLIALDALDKFIPLPQHSPVVRELQPMLLGNPDRQTVFQALQLQMLNDPAPRSVKRCEYLIENADKLSIFDKS